MPFPLCHASAPRKETSRPQVCGKVGDLNTSDNPGSGLSGAWEVRRKEKAARRGEPGRGGDIASRFFSPQPVLQAPLCHNEQAVGERDIKGEKQKLVISKKYIHNA